MRVALISDIHGNLLALESVLADLDREPPDEVVCLGDVAATGPRPHETVERLRDLRPRTVMGNADADMTRPLSPVTAGDDARRISEIDRWCAERLSAADLEHLRGFAPTLEIVLEGGATLLCFHGSPASYDEIVTADTPRRELERIFSGYGAEIMAGGHTHEQFLRRLGDGTLLNPGSVGLSPHWGEYAVVSQEDGRLSFDLRRVPLRSEEIAHDAIESGMPHAEWWASFWR